MADNIDLSNNRANIAYLGSRSDVWHHLGQEIQPGQPIEVWAKEAGLEWEAVKVPAIVDLNGGRFNHLPATHRLPAVEDRNFIVRSDTGHVLGYVSNRYQPVQPRDLLEWFDRYISVDDRFHLDVAGSLKQGEIIWATAKFNGDLSIAGDKHIARVLMSTTFDGSGATINQGTTTRVVCNNTLDAALADHRAVIRTLHSTKFDAAKVGKELAQIAQGFAVYKQVGDALAQVKFAKDEVSKFFKQCLNIPLEAKADEISGRKSNQFDALRAAYKETAAEGSTGTAWAALQAITRYVDHDRSSRGGASVDENRFASAQFGSGAQLKGKAFNLLVPRVKDKVPELLAA